MPSAFMAAQMTTRAPMARAAPARPSAVEKPPSRTGSSRACAAKVRRWTNKRSSTGRSCPFSPGELSPPQLAEDDRRQRRADEDEQHGREDGHDREDRGGAVAGGHAAEVLAPLVA